MPDTTHPNPGNLGNLPPETHSFVGRRAELAWLRAALDPAAADPAAVGGQSGAGAARLVSVVGAGGVGKTRLALRAAAEARAAYPDGVWLTELSPLHTAGLVDLAVMETLRLADQSTRPVLDVIAEWAYGKGCCSSSTPASTSSPTAPRSPPPCSPARPACASWSPAANASRCPARRSCTSNRCRWKAPTRVT